MKRKSITLAVLVDAFRYDYLNEADAPFFWSLAQSGIDASVQETFAFQLRPAFFAGLHPEECDIANLYCYGPETSPFRDLPFHLYDRTIIHRHIREQEALRGNTATRHIADIAEIPERLLPYFDLSEKKMTTDPRAFGERDSLFDIMREHGRKWLWIAYPTNDQRVGAILDRFAETYTPELDFAYLHFAELDWVGHEHGPHTPEQKRQLREIDRAVAAVYRRLTDDFEEVRVVIFGDHGMVKTATCYDIEEELNASGLTAPDDYLYFLDSTQARFWFFRDGAREKVTALLEKSPYGRLLGDHDLERLRFRFPDKQFGELIFAVNNGVVLFPNFFQKDAPCRGMHGYLPEVEANWGRLLVHGFGEHGKITEPVSMVSLFPTFLDLLDLPVPGACRVPSVFQLLAGEREEKGAPPLELSIVIPTCNRREKLAAVLAGLADQTAGRESFEVIVVDDGSTDGTGEMVAAMTVGSAITITSLRQENRGPAAARNRGAREARGRILLFLGDDTLPERTLVAEHLARHRELHSCAVLGHTLAGGEGAGSDFTGFVHLPYGESPLSTAEFPGKGAQFDFSRIDDSHDLHWSFFYTCNISLPRALFLEAGGFDEDFPHAAFEDSELGYRLWQRGMRIVFHEAAVVRHEHRLDFTSFCARQYKAGKSAVIFWKKHPELWRELGLDELLDNRFTLRFYNEGIRYNYLAGALHGMGLDVPLADAAEVPEGTDIKPVQQMFREGVLAEISRLRKGAFLLDQHRIAAESAAAVLRGERDAALREKEAALAQLQDLQFILDKYKRFKELAEKLIAEKDAQLAMRNVTTGHNTFAPVGKAAM